MIGDQRDRYPSMMFQHSRHVYCYMQYCIQLAQAKDQPGEVNKYIIHTGPSFTWMKFSQCHQQKGCGERNPGRDTVLGKRISCRTPFPSSTPDGHACPADSSQFILQAYQIVNDLERIPRDVMIPIAALIVNDNDMLNRTESQTLEACLEIISVLSVLSTSTGLKRLNAQLFIISFDTNVIQNNFVCPG